MAPVDHIKRFFAELRADETFAPFADEAERQLHVSDLAADGNADEAARFAAIEWIVRQDAPLHERLEVLARLTSLKGKVHIPSMQDFFTETLQQRSN